MEMEEIVIQNELKKEVINLLSYFSELTASQKNTIADQLNKVISEPAIEIILSNINTYRSLGEKAEEEEFLLLALIGKYYVLKDGTNTDSTDFKVLLSKYIKNREEELETIDTLIYCTSQSKFMVYRYDDFNNDQHLIKDISLRYLGFSRDEYEQYVKFIYEKALEITDADTFINQRIDFLKALLKYKEIYSRSIYRQYYLNSAKKNIEYSLKQIEKGWQF